MPPGTPAAFPGAFTAAAAATPGIPAAVVYVDKNVASRFYQGYCKATLWPTLHNVLDVYNTATMGASAHRRRGSNGVSSSHTSEVRLWMRG